MPTITTVLKPVILKIIAFLLLYFSIALPIFSQNGNVGIGTENPTAKLHIAGDLKVDSLKGTGDRNVIVDADGILKAAAQGNNATTSLELYDDEGDLRFQLDANEGLFQLLHEGDTVYAIQYIDSFFVDTTGTNLVLGQGKRSPPPGNAKAQSVILTAREIIKRYKSKIETLIPFLHIQIPNGGQIKDFSSRPVVNSPTSLSRFGILYSWKDANNQSVSVNIGETSGDVGEIGIVDEGGNVKIRLEFDKKNGDVILSDIYINTEEAFNCINVDEACKKQKQDKTTNMGSSTTYHYNGDNNTAQTRIDGSGISVNGQTGASFSSDDGKFNSISSSGSYSSNATNTAINNGDKISVFPNGGGNTVSLTFDAVNDEICFIGNLCTSGAIINQQGSSSLIDHPLDPKNRYLQHAAVESPNRMNIYNGNIKTDANGTAKVQLPNYFTALNKDFRYQLTVIGTFAQAIIAKKVQQNQFTIKTSEPHVEVSWQVTGIRNDQFAQDNHFISEHNKEPEMVGKLLYDPIQREKNNKKAWEQHLKIKKQLTKTKASRKK